MKKGGENQKMKSTKYLGYTVYENGTVIGFNGNELTKSLQKSGTRTYSVIIDEKNTQIPVRRFVYQAFNPHIDLKGEIVYSKDDSYNLDSLYLLNRNKKKVYQYNNMRKKQEIINKINELYSINENCSYAKLLEWVLGKDIENE